MKQLCPCHSGKTYETCCGPYHQGEYPPTALALMRSRYSAYALKNVDYILETTHPDHPDARTSSSKRRAEIHAFCENTTFKDLEILSFEDTLPYSYVTFRAYLLQNETTISFTEKSEFAQLKGRWLYRRALSIEHH